MRTIDADAIVLPKGFFEKVTNVPKFYDWLDTQPTIDAEPVKHGKWKYIGGYGYKYSCSVCVNCAERMTRYCPNCGAKMDGKEND